MKKMKNKMIYHRQWKKNKKVIKNNNLLIQKIQNKMRNLNQKIINKKYNNKFRIKNKRLIINKNQNFKQMNKIVMNK